MDDIIINEKWLEGRKEELEKLRAQVSNLGQRDLERFAESLGRKQKKRGKEKTFVSELLPRRNPISIPNHTKIFKFTAKNILDQLEEDIFQLENMIASPKRREI